MLVEEGAVRCVGWTANVRDLGSVTTSAWTRQLTARRSRKERKGNGRTTTIPHGITITEFKKDSAVH